MKFSWWHLLIVIVVLMLLLNDVYGANRTSHRGVVARSGYTPGIIADGWTQLRVQGYAVPSNDPSMTLGYTMPMYRIVEFSDGTIRVFRVR